jgi:hypothetical protein
VKQLEEARTHIHQLEEKLAEVCIAVWGVCVHAAEPAEAVQYVMR